MIHSRLQTSSPSPRESRPPRARKKKGNPVYRARILALLEGGLFRSVAKGNIGVRSLGS